MIEHMIAALDLADDEAEAIYVMPHNGDWVRVQLPDGHEFLVDRAELHAATAPAAESRRTAA